MKLRLVSLNVIYDLKLINFFSVIPRWSLNWPLLNNAIKSMTITIINAKNPKLKKFTSRKIITARCQMKNHKIGPFPIETVASQSRWNGDSYNHTNNKRSPYKIDVFLYHCCWRMTIVVFVYDSYFLRNTTTMFVKYFFKILCVWIYLK